MSVADGIKQAIRNGNDDGITNGSPPLLMVEELLPMPDMSDLSKSCIDCTLDTLIIHALYTKCSLIYTSQVLYSLYRIRRRRLYKMYLYFPSVPGTSTGKAHDSFRVRA